MVRATLLFLLMLMGPTLATAQCSMCRAVTGSNMYDESFVGTGLNPAILYLMALPYVMIALVIGFFYRKQLMEFIRKLAN